MQEIKTEARLRINGELVDVADLTGAQRKQLATWLKTTYLNALFQGEAVFSPAEEPAE